MLLQNLLPVTMILLLQPVLTFFNANQPSSTPMSAIYLPLIQKDTEISDVCIPPVNIPPDNIEQENAIASRINAEREKLGLYPLTLVPELTQAARRHSNDMADNDFFDHTGSDGSNAGQRIETACYDWSAWGEIIGCRSDGDANEMVAVWLDSPPHRAIILDDIYVDFGVGYAFNPGSACLNYWTVDFARMAPSTSNSFPGN